MEFSEKELNIAITHVILVHCVRSKITINRLAKLSGIRQSTLDNILKGKSGCPRLDTLMKISDGLKLHFVDFIKTVIDVLNGQFLGLKD